MKIAIITCPQWKAKKPKASPVIIGPAHRIIIHHTDGHHPEISNPKDESYAEAVRYAQEIQTFHMEGNGWNDSGHNFLVCRNGDILQGRWLTVSAIEAGHMVLSAHCPGQNTEVGIEHEHVVGELPTPVQLQSSAELIAWISVQYKLKNPLPLAPHRQYYNTDCPDNLVKYIPTLSRMAKEILST